MALRALQRRGAAILTILTLAACDDSPSFSHYVLALSWQPAFCELNAERQECRELDNDDYAAGHLTVHGLWPSDGPSSGPSYCGVEAPTKALDQPESWCELPRPEITPKTRAALESAMPGTASCLDRHEWIKHGTCTGTDAEPYFGNAVRLAAAIQATPLGDVIAANIGRYVTPQQLTNAFEAAFGAGAGHALTLICTRRGGALYLSEIRVALEPAALEDRLDRNSLHFGGARPAGSCPDDMRIDPAGQ